MRRGHLFLGMLTALASLPVLPAQAAASAASHVQVASAVHYDVSPPLASLQPKLPAAVAPHAIPQRALSSKGLTTAPADPGLQSSNPAAAAPSTSTSFDGVGVGFTGPQGSFTPNAAPPDPNGAVGATQYVQWVNESFAVFNKSTGAVVKGPITGNTLWTGFGGPCETDNDGDPIAQYDKAANRWVMSQFAVSSGSPYYQCFAVSTTSDATGTYNRYSFKFTTFPDYPKIGVWPDAYYVSFNMFQSATGPEVGGEACAFDRLSMLAGAAATMQCQPPSPSTTYDGLLPADLDGVTPPPAGSPGYFLDYGTNSLNLFSFHVDWAQPGNTTFSSPTSIPVTAFSPTCGGGTCIPQTGTRQQLDSLADRLMYRLAYRNFGDHESLVVNHSVVANGTSGIRWYEIRSPRSSPAIYQSGTYAPNDGNWRWMGSIAMDAVGDMAVGYSVSSGLIHPSISYTGRIPSDPAGTMEAEVSLITGAGSQTRFLNRWGDYTSMSVDPVDDCTFWYTDEYLKANGTFNWSTGIGSFKFPGCVAAPTGLTATPVTASQVNLAWSAVSAATGYNVQRSADGSTGWTQIGSSTGPSFSNTGLTASTTYYYRVLATNASGSSLPSQVASATTPLSWSATFSVANTPLNWAANQTQTYSVTLTNNGNQTWPAGGGNPVHLGVHFITGGNWATDQRFTLPNDVSPGASVTLTIAVTAPGSSGSMTLEYEMVKESQFWFSQVSDVAVTVAPPWSASYSAGSTPLTWASNQTQTYSVTLTNNGTQTWPAGGGNPVHLGVHFIIGGNWATDQRFTLPNDVLPGQSVTLTISVTAPGTNGSMTLEYEMVKESQFWFSQVSDVAVSVT